MKKPCLLTFAPHNVFTLFVKVTSAGVCKLGDFGCSVSLSANGKGPEIELAGTPGYQVNKNFRWNNVVINEIFCPKAPELLKGELPSKACDVYSFGILLWQLDSRSVPYLGQHPQVDPRKIF